MPSLLLDKIKCLKNIERMATKARSGNLGFRPHFKTHQSAEIGDWFSDFGVSKITVSSFSMAAYFAQAGWRDILVAFPFNPLDIKQLNRLSETCKISILIDNLEILPFLTGLKNEVRFFIDIDTGYGRSGVKSDEPDQVDQIIRTYRTIKNLRFSGFYCHAGHSYIVKSQAERDKIHLKALSDLKALKDQFGGEGIEVLYGDTPNCSTQSDFRGIDELTPGNFVFYDLFQYSIGSCDVNDIAVALACPVVSKYAEDKRVLIHGGAVHFSKETVQMGGEVVFGLMVDHSRNGWAASTNHIYLSEVWQDHGIIRNWPEIYDNTRIGDLIYFLPVHSCLAANLMKSYVTVHGEVLTRL